MKILSATVPLNHSQLSGLFSILIRADAMRVVFGPPAGDQVDRVGSDAGGLHETSLILKAT